MTLPRPHKASSPAWSRCAQSAPRSNHGKNCSGMEPTPMVRWKKRTIPSRDWTRRALAFWKGELRPLFGRGGGGAPPLSSWSPRFSSLHQLAHIAGDHVRPSALLVAPFPSSAPSFFPSLHADAGVAVHSTRLPWPPPISVLESGNPWSQRTSDRVCDGAYLPRGWRQGPDQHHRA